MAKKRVAKTQEQIDRQKRHDEVQQKLQQFCDSHIFELMSDCMKSWNSKNTYKITEMIKMDNRFNFHFSDGMSVMITNETMRLG